MADRRRMARLPKESPAHGSGSCPGATVMYGGGHQRKQPVMRCMAEEKDLIVLRTVLTVQGAPAGGQHSTPAALFHCVEHSLCEGSRIAAHHAAEADVNGLGTRGKKPAQRLGRGPVRLIEEPIAGDLAVVRPVRGSR